jgi:hypothetical protein
MEKTDMAEILRTSSEPAQSFAFFPRVGKQSSGRSAPAPTHRHSGARVSANPESRFFG